MEMDLAFYDLYNNQIRKQMKEEFKYENDHMIPKLSKVSLNMGVGSESLTSKHAIKSASEDLALISGQKPVIIKARRSVSGFKLREGMPIGVKVTLRRKMMYHFLKKMVYVVLPRVRDFRGLKSGSFDGNGNYSFGLKEQIIFPEIVYDKVDNIRGLDISIVTTANTDAEAEKLLSLFSFPFKNSKNR